MSASAWLRVSTSSFARRSSSAWTSASRIAFEIWSFDIRCGATIVSFSDFPVPLSVAVTVRMPLASMSNVTSICGIPRGAGGRPVR